MSVILPKTRPKRDAIQLDRIAERYNLDGSKPAFVFVRGWYLDTVGQPGVNDYNLWDDAAFLLLPDGTAESFNANTDPSVAQRGKRKLAKLNLGRYQFYKGRHKNRYAAFRSYPEGVILNVTRNGQPSTAQFINIHKGAAGDATDRTWSEGCLTIHGLQWNEFQTRSYAAMDKYNQTIIDCVLVENQRTPAGQRIVDHFGKVI